MIYIGYRNTQREIYSQREIMIIIIIIIIIKSHEPKNSALNKILLISVGLSDITQCSWVNIALYLIQQMPPVLWEQREKKIKIWSKSSLVCCWVSFTWESVIIEVTNAFCDPPTHPPNLRSFLWNSLPLTIRQSDNLSHSPYFTPVSKPTCSPKRPIFLQLSSLRMYSMFIHLFSSPVIFFLQFLSFLLLMSVCV